MRIIGGPPGSGKSTAFPMDKMGVDFFNVDDRCAELNDGSYSNTTPDIRSKANCEFEEFIKSKIEDGNSFAFETTLRTDITFHQASEAKKQGFFIYLTYLALQNVEQNIERVRARALNGGHSAPPPLIREIHAASLSNFTRAVREFDLVVAYDNSRQELECVLKSANGQIEYISSSPPEWLREALKNTEYEKYLKN